MPSLKVTIETDSRRFTLRPELVAIANKLLDALQDYDNRLDGLASQIERTLTIENVAQIIREQPQAPPAGPPAGPPWTKV